MEQKKINLFEHHQKFDEDVLISYKGPFGGNILVLIGDYIKNIIKQDKKSSRKIFTIFIELAQNIAYYSNEKKQLSNKEEGVGILIISEFPEFYTFSAGNIVKNDDIVPVIEKCEIINSLNRENLRKYKREQRNQPAGQKGNAHIGLIQVALTSENPLEIEVNPITENTSFFSIRVKINKNGK